MSLAETIEQLYKDYGQMSGITIECQRDLVAIGVKNKAASAEVFLQGAQVTRYQRQGESPLLFLSKDCHYRSGSSLRGGIPICWPWFGDLQRNPMEIQQQIPTALLALAPAHGFVRNRDWQVESIETPSDHLTVIRMTYHTETDEVCWPLATQLICEISIGESLSVEFSVHNVSPEVMHFSSALHSYLAVDNIKATTISGFDKAVYIDALDDWQSRIQQDDIAFLGEVDRIYLDSPQPTTLQDGHRTTKISTVGSATTVIWNPWIDKSQRLSQFASTDYQRMVCIETANVLSDAVTLAPGQSYSLSVCFE